MNLNDVAPIVFVIIIIGMILYGVFFIIPKNKKRPKKHKNEYETFMNEMDEMDNDKK